MYLNIMRNIINISKKLNDAIERRINTVKRLTLFVDEIVK